MPRPARQRHHETAWRIGDGPVERELRAMPSRTGEAVRVRARSLARGLHRLPYAARLNQLQAFGAARREPVPEMPCADAKSQWPDVHRQAGPFLFRVVRRVLERRLPPGDPRVEHQPKNALLRTKETERADEQSRHDQLWSLA